MQELFCKKNWPKYLGASGFCSLTVTWPVHVLLKLFRKTSEPSRRSWPCCAATLSQIRWHFGPNQCGLALSVAPPTHSQSHKHIVCTHVQTHLAHSTYALINCYLDFSPNDYVSNMLCIRSCSCVTYHHGWWHDQKSGTYLVIQGPEAKTCMGFSMPVLPLSNSLNQ